MSLHSPNAQKHLTKNPLKRYLLDRFYGSVVEIVRTMNPRSVLDVGCGEGFLTQIIHKRFPAVPIVGIDLNEEAIGAARERCPDVQFQVGNIEKLPFDTNSYDLVMCSEVLEHVTEPEVALSEICRISNQHVFVSVPYEPWFRILNLLALNHLPSGNAPGHINHWGMRAFGRLLSAHMEVRGIRSSLPWILINGLSPK